MLFRIDESWFRYIHSNFLVYNTSWEDANVDREILQLQPDSSVLMISSAGCNALSYLLDNPGTIQCIDNNFRQNALLELKIGLIQYGKDQYLTKLFLTGKSPEYQSIYQEIRPNLSKKTKAFWDRHIHYFSPSGRGFYYSGTAGIFAWALNQLLALKGIRKNVQTLFDTPSAQEREHIFREIEDKLWTGISQYLWKSDISLSLAGIPSYQRQAVPDLNDFMRSALHHIFVQENPAENHYWRVYLKGSYTPECCPDYLISSNFKNLRQRIPNLEFKTIDLLNHLIHTDRVYTHYVLLDHMDWMAGVHTLNLEKQWRLILKHSRTGTKILFRSAYQDLDFLPDFIFPYVEFINARDMELKSNDKVGTYSQTWLGVVK